MQNGAANVAWWSIDVDEVPWKCELTTKIVVYQIPMQFSGGKFRRKRSPF